MSVVLVTILLSNFAHLFGGSFSQLGCHEPCVVYMKWLLTIEAHFVSNSCSIDDTNVLRLKWWTDCIFLASTEILALIDLNDGY
jgi:hypothetical protein